MLQYTIFSNTILKTQSMPCAILARADWTGGQYGSWIQYISSCRLSKKLKMDEDPMEKRKEGVDKCMQS